MHVVLGSSGQTLKTYVYLSLRMVYKYINMCGNLPTIIYIYAVHSAQVFRTNWWMHHYLSLTPKRHYGYSNSPCVRGLDKGKLVGWKQRDKKLKVATAVQYKDSKGKLRYKGTKHLKKTETLDSNNQNDPNKRYIQYISSPTNSSIYPHV